MNGPRNRRLAALALGFTLVATLGDSPAHAEELSANDTTAVVAFFEKLVPAMGPEQCLLVFRASAEKGLLLAFQIGTTGADYRDSLLGAFASYCEAYRAELLARGITPALDPACRPLDWWTLLEAASENEERASGSGVNIGMLGFEG